VIAFLNLKKVITVPIASLVSLTIKKTYENTIICLVNKNFFKIGDRNQVFN